MSAPDKAVAAQEQAHRVIVDAVSGAELEALFQDHEWLKEIVAWMEANQDPKCFCRNCRAFRAFMAGQAPAAEETRKTINFSATPVAQ